MKALRVRVTPKASANRVTTEVDEAGETLYRVYVTVVPEDGKANDAVIKLLAKHLGVARSALTITRGLTSREKIIVVRD